MYQQTIDNLLRVSGLTPAQDLVVQLAYDYAALSKVHRRFTGSDEQTPQDVLHVASGRLIRWGARRPIPPNIHTAALQADSPGVKGSDKNAEQMTAYFHFHIVQQLAALCIELEKSIATRPFVFSEHCSKKLADIRAAYQLCLALGSYARSDSFEEVLVLFTRLEAKTQQSYYDLINQLRDRAYICSEINVFFRKMFSDFFLTPEHALSLIDVQCILAYTQLLMPDTNLNEWKQQFAQTTFSSLINPDRLNCIAVMREDGSLALQCRALMHALAAHPQFKILMQQQEGLAAQFQAACKRLAPEGTGLTALCDAFAATTLVKSNTSSAAQDQAQHQGMQFNFNS